MLSLYFTSRGTLPASRARHSAIRPPNYSIFLLLAALALAFAPDARAAVSASADYSLVTSTVNDGGQRVGSSHYTVDASVGEVGGLATASSPAIFAKTGYTGQLFDVAGLLASASPTSVNETQTTALGAAQVLDDASFLALSSSAVSWSIVFGPVASISVAGLVTTQNVYANTPATVRGSYAGFISDAGLTVINVGNDDFGIYANDGIPDTWQVTYFGVGTGAGSPAGLPTADPDHDGQTNLFEYVAGTDPTIANSFSPVVYAQFSVSVANVPGHPTQRQIIFSPRFAGRTYTVQSTTSLTGGSWTTLTNTTVSNNGATRTVTDLNAVEPIKFYRVIISQP